MTNHNLAVQQNPPPPEPTPPNATPVKTPVRPLPVNSFQVNCSSNAHRNIGNSHPWLCEKLFFFFFYLSRWRCWGMADRRFLWTWTQACCFSTGRPCHLGWRGSRMRGVRQNAFLFISHVNVVPADVCWASVLHIVKLQSKIRMVIDSHHNTPREMTFESVRVRKLYP